MKKTIDVLVKSFVALAFSVNAYAAMEKTHSLEKEIIPYSAEDTSISLIDKVIANNNLEKEIKPYSQRDEYAETGVRLYQNLGKYTGIAEIIEYTNADGSPGKGLKILAIEKDGDSYKGHVIIDLGFNGLDKKDFGTTVPCSGLPDLIETLEEIEVDLGPIQDEQKDIYNIFFNKILEEYHTPAKSTTAR